MKKILSLISLLLVLSLSTLSPVYAASHEKKEAAVETKTEEATEANADDAAKKKDKKKKKDAEEPECE